ncbi:hypothetical protein [Rhodopirellula sp. P2]|uniref:hypothetical protein n=1 Tax=Rhodopirellula sp. P2 TaxID=2127060 RepID=UPI0023686311|nr:hypothetical protein [Rhodopirellula sp. P2]WDQ18408.1 hypothetical protein PSR62_07640 [Rhodopirellula sp. P2]
MACFGAHWLDAASAFGQRLSRPKTVASDVAVTWLSSFFDAVSRLEHQRVTGQHGVLMHSTPIQDPVAMVGEMDGHIEGMCALLGRTPPENVIWVRGSLLSQTGVSIGPWAITDDDQPAAEFSSLDRHEIAHSVISGLCGPDQDPPRLLVEGWAQFQGNDWSAEIPGLSNQHRNQAHFLLDELIEEPWYSASRWPLYRYGGPLVAFLIQRFSAEQFLELYGQARKETFRADAERILGSSWENVERSFWIWIESEAGRLAEMKATENGIQTVVELGDQVSPGDWDSLVSHYDASQWDAVQFEKSFAFKVDVEVEESSLSEPYSRQVRVAIGSGQKWLVYQNPWGSSIGVATGPSLSVSVERSSNGLTTGFASGMEGRAQARGDMHHYLRVARRTYLSDPASEIPIGERWPERLARFRCESIRRPPPASGVGESPRIWIVQYRDWIPADDTETSTAERSGEIWLDESLGMAVKRHQLNELGSTNRSERNIGYQRLGGLILPRTVEETSVEASETLIARFELEAMTESEVASMKQEILSMADEVELPPGRPWFENVLLGASSLPLLGVCFVLFGSSPHRREADCGPMSHLD